MAGCHLGVARGDGIGLAELTVLAVHVVGAGARVVPEAVDGMSGRCARKSMSSMGGEREFTVSHQSKSVGGVPVTVVAANAARMTEIVGAKGGHRSLVEGNLPPGLVLARSSVSLKPHPSALRWRAHIGGSKTADERPAQMGGCALARRWC